MYTKPGWNHGNLKWLEANTLFLTRHGSHAYGTSTPESDLDIRGIFVAPKEYYLGYGKHIEQYEQKSPDDVVIFEIRKFFKLAADANPNALEILFTDPSDHLFISPIGQKLLDNKEMFLSRKIKYTMAGYAHSQLARLSLHRRFVMNPILKEPTREEFGLPDKTKIPRDQLEAVFAMVKKRVDEWNFHNFEHVDPATREFVMKEFERILLEVMQWSYQDKNKKIEDAAIASFGFDTNFLHYLDQERRYHAKRKEWQSYNDWKKNRNPKRAAIEEKFGIDLKHAAHLYRLLTSCKEVLTEGVLRVRRPDAADILAIRNGKWSYEELLDFATRMEVELSELVKTSCLPHSVDQSKISQFCTNLIEEFSSGNGTSARTQL